MIRATKRRTMSVLRTPGAVALLCTGLVCMTALLTFAPDDVRAWLIGPGLLGAATTAVGLFVQLRTDRVPEPDPREPQPPQPPDAP